MAEPDEEPPLTVAEIMGLIRSDAKDDRLDGLIELSEVIDGAFGEDAALLGEQVRELEGVMVLAWLINDPEVEVQQQALLVLGNLCSDACDPNSYLTKQQLLLAGADRTITMVLQSEDANVLLYACGCIQNLCVDDEWAQALVENHVEGRLAELLVHENYRVVNYAAGAIKNVMQRVGRSDELQQLPPDQLAAIEKRDRDMLLHGIRYRRAIKKLVQFARSIPPEKRLQRIRAASNGSPKPPSVRPDQPPEAAPLASSSKCPVE